MLENGRRDIKSWGAVGAIPCGCPVAGRACASPSLVCPASCHYTLYACPAGSTLRRWRYDRHAYAGKQTLALL